MMALCLHPVCACHVWILTACFLLTAHKPGTWHTLLSWQVISFPSLFTPRMLFAAVSLRCYFLHYSLHFPTLFSSSSNLCCLHISTVLTSLLSSHLYSLHIPTLFTSTFSSHLFFFTSLLSSTLERRTQTGPVAQTRFPTSTPGATFRDKHRVSCDSYPPSITWTNRWSSHSAAKCKPGSPNTMAQRIFKKHLRAALTVGCSGQTFVKTGPGTHLPRPLPLLLGWRSLYFGSMLVHLGTMLVPILFLLVFLLCFWLSCFGSRCLRGCCELVDVVGASLLGMLRRLGVYVGASWDYLLRLCWGLLAYVGPSWDYVGRSWVVCWAILALSRGHLGTMLGFVGSSWAYVGPAWDYVGRSWVLCWAILALCWPILGHVARRSNLTPCNSLQRAVFTVIYKFFLHISNTQITLPPPMAPYVGRSWVLCWAILALCWPILGHVARCSNLTPCNSPQRAVFTVIYSVFCTFPTPIVSSLMLLVLLCLACLGACCAVLGFMLEHLGTTCWGYVGVCWPMLAHLGIMLGVPGLYVGPSWLYLGAILGLCWVLLGRLGPMLAQLGTMLGVPGFYVGPSWLCVGLSWGMLRDAATWLLVILPKEQFLL